MAKVDKNSLTQDYQPANFQNALIYKAERSYYIKTEKQYVELTSLRKKSNYSLTLKYLNISDWDPSSMSNSWDGSAGFSLDSPLYRD